jgi:phage terminase small subunit
MAYELTDKQRRFCEEYLIDLNATQAAIRAGYSEKTAHSIGNENLIKPEINTYISELQQKRSEKTAITAEMILQELAKLGFSDISNFYEDDGVTLRNVKELGNRLSAAISQIKVTETTHGTGKFQKKEVKTEFKLHDKLAALEKIARHIGFFEKDNDQNKAQVNIINLGSGKKPDETTR